MFSDGKNFQLGPNPSQIETMAETDRERAAELYLITLFCCVLLCSCITVLCHYQAPSDVLGARTPGPRQTGEVSL